MILPIVNFDYQSIDICMFENLNLIHLHEIITSITSFLFILLLICQNIAKGEIVCLKELLIIYISRAWSKMLTLNTRTKIQILGSVRAKVGYVK